MKKPRVITEEERVEREESLVRMVRGLGKLLVELEPDYLEDLLRERSGENSFDNERELSLKV